ncbi:hypothetical protein D3C80_918150 [compost metagenome]
MHLAVDFQLRRHLIHQLERFTHLAGCRVIGRTKAGMGQQRDLRLNAETTHGFRRHQGDFRQLLRRRIVIDIGVSDKGVAAWQQQRIHRPGDMGALTEAKYFFNHVVMLVIAADGAADHRIRLAAMQHDGGNQRRVADHRTARLFLRNAAAFHDLVVLAPVFIETRIGLVVHHFKVFTRRQLQTEFFQPHFDHARAPHQNRIGQALRHQLLSGVQYPFFFAFRHHHPLHFLLRLGKDRFHEQVGFVNEFRQLFDIGIKVFDRPRRHARLHRRLGHCRSDFNNQARIERFGNDVFRAK